MDREELDKLAAASDGKCAICDSRTASLVVDHCHGSNELRGMLCHSCNVALGYLKESPRIAYAAAYYLDHHRRKHGEHSETGAGGEEPR
jgi:hypothetical protein